jgi:hypothetical protein
MIYIAMAASSPAGGARGNGCAMASGQAYDAELRADEIFTRPGRGLIARE